MIGRHYQDDAVTIAKPRTGEEANGLPHESFIRVRVDNVAAWMWISKE
jgi:hypothetical protein